MKNQEVIQLQRIIISSVFLIPLAENFVMFMSIIKIIAKVIIIAVVIVSVMNLQYPQI